MRTRAALPHRRTSPSSIESDSIIAEASRLANATLPCAPSNCASRERSRVHASEAALPTEETVHEPPWIGAGGSAVSPGANCTSSMRMRSASAAICEMAVYARCGSRA